MLEDGVFVEGILLGRTQRRIDLQSWEDILDPHIERAIANDFRDGWLIDAVKEAIQLYGGKLRKSAKTVSERAVLVTIPRAQA